MMNMMTTKHYSAMVKICKEVGVPYTFSDMADDQEIAIENSTPVIKHYSEVLARCKQFGAPYKFSNMADDHEIVMERLQLPASGRFIRDAFAVMADNYEMRAMRIEEPVRSECSTGISVAVKEGLMVLGITPEYVNFQPSSIEAILDEMKW